LKGQTLSVIFYTDMEGHIGDLFAFPGLKKSSTLAFAIAIFVNLFVILIAVHDNLSPTCG
jgi:hypothetical protein